jgi:ATP-binding cassette subfamily C protein
MLCQAIAAAGRQVTDGGRQTDRVGGARATGAGPLAALVAFGVASNLLMLAGPLFMLVVYDIVLPAGSTETLVVLLLMLAAAQAVQSLVDLSRTRVLARMGASLRLTEGAPAAFAGAKGTAQSGATVQAFLGSAAALAVLDLPFLPVMLAVLFLFHPLMGALAIGGISLLAAIGGVERRLACGPRQRLDLAAASAAEEMARAGPAAEYLAATGQGGAAARRWRRHDTAAMIAHLRLGDTTAACAVASRGVRVFLQSATIALGAGLAIRGELTGGAMVAGSLLMSRILGPFDQAMTAVPQALRVWQMHRATRRRAAPIPTAPRLPGPTRVAAEGLAFAVEEGARPVLSGIEFAVGPGQILLILGRSGAGKSVLLRLVAGLLPASAGRITVGGVAAGRHRPGPAAALGYLPARPAFGAGTVAEAIAGEAPDPGDPGPIHAAARQAARAAGVEMALLSLPDGFDTPAPMAEASLSQGQLHRMALARALAGRPDILLLDDPDIAHDPEGFAILAAALRSARARGAAVIVTARQAQLLPLADLVLLIEGGRMQAFGPVGQVMAGLSRRASVAGAAAPAPAPRGEVA